MALFSSYLLLVTCLAHLGTTLKCQSDSKGLKVDFGLVKGANYYEVQIASSPNGPPFAAQSTEAKNGSYVYIYGALKGHTYYVRLRSHASSSAWRLLHGWSNPGSWYKCVHSPSSRYEGYQDATNLTSSPLPPREDVSYYNMSELHRDAMLPRSTKAETFNLGVVRQAKGPTPDYLDEKNAAGYGLDSWYAHAGGFVQLFCVEILKQTISNVYSYDTRQSRHYANYLSCNELGKDYVCTPMIFADCFALFSQLPLFSSRCRQIDHYSTDSRKYVGKGQGKKILSGWDAHFNAYSFPYKAECRDHEDVGTKRSDGSVCSWKRHEHFRTAIYHGGGAAAMEKALHNLPLEGWQCANLKESLNVVV